MDIFQRYSILAQQYPEIVNKVIHNPPPEIKADVDLARAALAGGSFTVEAYKHFHFVIYDRELPPHGERWVGKMFEVFNKTGIRGLLNKASRGFTKSTVAVGFSLFAHGHFPWKSGLITQARDRDAMRTSEFMSDTISSNAGWRAAFPHIVPDKERGWSSNGFFIKDDRVPYDEWIKKTASDHGRDPSFMSVSIISGAIGMHPTLYLMMDDIHDNKNTSSPAELASIKKTVFADVLPTMSNPSGSPFLCVSYTPWGDDTYAELEKSGLFEMMVTPAFEYDENGQNEWEGAKITLTWPDLFPVDVLMSWKTLLGKREFGRMFLCDLELGRGEALRYYTYPHDAVDQLWPTVGGIDVPFDFKERHESESHLSSFAMAFVGKRPQGGAVFFGGEIGRLTMAQCFNVILAAQSNFLNWIQALCEDVSGGRVFRTAAKLMYPHMRIIGSDLGKLIKLPGEGSGKAKNKKTRIQTELAPWLENGTVLISDADIPILKAARDGLDHFTELDDRKPDERLDALDALYHAVKGIPEVLIGRQYTEEFSNLFNKQKTPHPLAGRRERNRR